MTNDKVRGIKERLHTKFYTYSNTVTIEAAAFNALDELASHYDKEIATLKEQFALVQEHLNIIIGKEQPDGIVTTKDVENGFYGKGKLPLTTGHSEGVDK